MVVKSQNDLNGMPDYYAVIKRGFLWNSHLGYKIINITQLQIRKILCPENRLEYIKCSFPQGCVIMHLYSLISFHS